MKIFNFNYLFILLLIIGPSGYCQDLSLIILTDAQQMPSTILITQAGSEEKELVIKILVKKNRRPFAEKSYELLLKTSQVRLRIKDYLEDIGYGEQGIEQQIDWELCAEALDRQTKERAYSCQVLPSIPALPPHLVYPFDEDEIETPLPNLSWTAPAPFSPTDPVRYSLKMVELQGYYPPKVAIRELPAFYLQEDLRTQIHPYSVRGEKLELHKTYVWQVQARTVSGRYLGQSEVWTFKLKNPESKKESPRPDGPFVELKRKLDGSYYPAFGFVQFKHDCLYEEEGLSWKILDARGMELVLPSSSLEQVAKNLFSLELPPGSGLQEGNFYVMELTDPKGQVEKLKFKYYYAK